MANDLQTETAPDPEFDERFLPDVVSVWPGLSHARTAP